MILYFKKRIRDGGGWSDWKAFRGGHFSSLSSSSLDRALAAALSPHLRPLYLLAPGATKVGELETGSGQSWGLLSGACRMGHTGGKQGDISEHQGRGCPSDSTVQWDGHSGLGRGWGAEDPPSK